MRRFKWFCSLALIWIIAFSLHVSAEDADISISDISAKNGRISVNIINNTQEEVLLTVTLEKQDDSLDDVLKYYGIRQKNIGAGKTEEYGFVIPDERDGIPGSGDYIISVQNRKKVSERITMQIDYADANEINMYMQKLKDAVNLITTEEPYEKILPILESEDSKGVFFSIGADYEAFVALDTEVKQQIANLLYYNADIALNKEEFAEEFLGLFSLGIYNSGDKEGGLSYLNPTYNGETADPKFLGNVTDMMDSTYKSNKDFLQGYKVAYGIEKINRAKLNTIEDVLGIFRNETGVCKSAIDRILKLSESSKNTAFEYIIKSVNKDRVTNEEGLDELLKKAYSAALNNNSGNGGSGGGGGGASGSVANKAENKQSSMSVAAGSGAVEEKVESSLIFSDFPNTHWAAESVIALKAKGVVNGTDTGAFEPDRAVTREEFAKMLVSVCGFELEGTSNFADVEENEWYFPYIGSAVKNGIVKGLGDGRFGVGETITRQDMAVMTKRAMTAMNTECKQIREYVVFSDENLIADYAADAVRALYESGVINGKGDGIFDPLGQATRAEAAKIIYEAVKGGV